MRLQVKRRNILYLRPRHGWFVAGFALGDAAVAVARNSTLPPGTIESVNRSKRYAEGTAVWIEVKTAKDLEIVKSLAKIKIEN